MKGTDTTCTSIMQLRETSNIVDRVCVVSSMLFRWRGIYVNYIWKFTVGTTYIPRRICVHAYFNHPLR